MLSATENKAIGPSDTKDDGQQPDADDLQLVVQRAVPLEDGTWDYADDHHPTR